MDYKNQYLDDYLSFCQYQRCLNSKTINAYRTDLLQFMHYFSTPSLTDLNKTQIEEYIIYLHNKYMPKTCKRKIASLKAYYHYLDYSELLSPNPFNKIQTKFREPVVLPKTIPVHTLERFYGFLYAEKQIATTNHKRKCAIRNIAIIELLFATGIRISELCVLKKNDVDLHDGFILVNGKGFKQRKIQIGNSSVLESLNTYKSAFLKEIDSCGYFFVSTSATHISDQSIRRMINRLARQASIDLHITPHMFRHTFATCLLEADVDIRYIQEILGHSSINVTEIYTHVALAKQKDILTNKHPRNTLNILST